MHLVPLNVMLIGMVVVLLGSVSKALPLLLNVWWFFGLQFALLIVALMIDSASAEARIGDLAGLVKPIYLLLFAFAGASLCMSLSKVTATANYYFAIIVILGIALGAVELLSASGESWIYDLYKREERYILRGKTTTWFGVTYYHGYFYLLVTVFFYQKLRTRGSGLADGLLLLCSGLLVLTAQSRTIVATLFLLTLVSLLALFFGRSVRALVAALASAVAVIVVVAVSLPFLEEHFWYLRVAIESLSGSSFYAFLTQGSMGVRIDQISSAVDQSHIIIGAGLGRNDVPLESIYASYFYRFGFLPGLLFIACYTSLGALLYTKTAREDYLGRALGVMWLVSPIALFSSPMHEFPKIAVVLFFLSGYLMSRVITSWSARE